MTQAPQKDQELLVMIKLILLISLISLSAFSQACGKQLVVDLKYLDEKISIDGKDFFKDKDFCSNAKDEVNANFKIVYKTKSYNYEREFFLSKKNFAESLGKDKKKVKIETLYNAPTFRQIKIPIDDSALSEKAIVQVIELSNKKVLMETEIEL